MSRRRFGTGLSLLLWVAGCDPRSGLVPCDIRHAACQQDVLLAVQRVRGGEWDPWLDATPMRVISQADYREELRRDVRDPVQGDFDHFEAALELLGLLDPARDEDDVVDAGISNVVAYYSGRDKRITIIDRGDGGDHERDTRTLAHELVHAAQDREFGLRDFERGKSRDEAYARAALVEGEATLYQELVLLDYRGVDAQDLEWDAYFAERFSAAWGDAFAATSPELELYSLLYPLGGHYLADRYLAGGNPRVRGAFRSPAVQVLSLTDVDAETGAPGCAPPTAPTGYTQAGETRMGVLPLFGVATRITDAAYSAWEIAEGWRDDRLYYFGDDADQTLVVWRLRFAREAEESFMQGMLAHRDDALLAVAGDLVTVILRSDPALEVDRRWGECHPE